MQHSPTHGEGTRVSQTGIGSGAAMFDTAASPTQADDLAKQAGKGGAMVYQRPAPTALARSLPMVLALVLAILLGVALLLLRGG